MARAYTVGDTPTLTVTCMDGPSAMDLSGFSATLRFSVDGQTTKTGAMSVINATSGLVRYSFGFSDLDESGVCHLVVQLTNGTSTYTSNEFTRRVKELL